MHPEPRPSDVSGPWWRGLTSYMWWVLAIAALGWLFDVMDQRIFVLSRTRALDELLSKAADEPALRKLTAAEAEALLGLAHGTAPQAPVVIEEPSATQKRAALVLPPLAEGAAPRRLGILRPHGSQGEVFVLPEPGRNEFIGRIATAIFLAGWATGGLLFGVLGDKLGRVYTIVVTILVYSVFTGLSALSVSWIDYSAYRFLTGMGVGGEFAAGAALVAEVMPHHARPYALGLLQTLSAVGNIIGSLIARWVLPPADPASSWEHWRSLYLVGIVPALLVFVVMRGKLKEPEKWRAAKESAGALVGKQLGAFGDLFAPRWRRGTVVGMSFAIAGVIGVWGISFWTPELVKGIVLDPNVGSNALALQDVGAFLGLLAMTLVTQGAPRWRIKVYLPGTLAFGAVAGAFAMSGALSPDHPFLTACFGIALCAALHCLLGLFGAVTGGIGRRGSFVLAFLLALASTVLVFKFMTRVEQVYWMIPILGFCTLLAFGLYSIYFPELYPTRLRSTGTGFCYNVARYVAGVALLLLGYLGGRILWFDLRISTLTFAAVFYAIGVVAAAFAPETKDRPLADEG